MRDYEIDSDLRSIIIQKKLKFKQHDNGSTIKVNLYENGEKVNIDLAWTIVAKFKRADRNEYNRDVTSISDNSFITTLDSTVTAIVGDLEIDFKITYGDKQVTTFTVLLEIEESIGEGNSGDIGGNTGGNTEINVDLSTLKLSLDGTDLVLKNGTTDLSRVTLPTIAGKNVELQSNGTYIQYRYEGDTDWNNLVALSSLKGTDGDTGLSAYELAQQETGFAGTVEQWLNSLVGTTPNLQIGTVETLASGSSATASITGTEQNPLLNLGIPRGADGTGTGGSSEKEWELIQEGEITEEVNAIALTSEKLYSEFLLFTKGFTSKEGTYVTTELGVFTVGAPYQVGTIKNVNTENSLSVTEIKIINGKCALGKSYNKLGTGNAWNPSTQTSYLYEHTQQTSSKIQIKCGNANARITGGIFTLYGR